MAERSAFEEVRVLVRAEFDGADYRVEAAAYERIGVDIRGGGCVSCAGEEGCDGSQCVCLSYSVSISRECVILSEPANKKTGELFMG